MPSTLDLAARLSAVVAAQQDMVAVANDREKLMRLAVDRTRAVTKGAGAAIELVEDGVLVCRAGSGSAADQIGLTLPVEWSFSGRAVRDRTVMRCDDTATDSRVDAAACRALGIRSMIVAPLVQGNTGIGALKTFSARADSFDDLDAYTLQLLAGMTSVALMLAHEFQERKASEDRYRLLFDRNVAGVFRTTRDGRILDCNRAFVEYLGYGSREELLARESWDLYPERGDREAFLAVLDRERAMTNLRLHLRKKDGSPVTGVVNVSYIPGEEGETQILGTLVEEVQQA